LPNKIGYLLGLPTKKLDQIIYYERYVVINGYAPMQKEMLMNMISYRRRIPGYPRKTSERKPIPR
jgi:hypothetical protein